MQKKKVNMKLIAMLLIVVVLLSGCGNKISAGQQKGEGNVSEFEQSEESELPEENGQLPETTQENSDETDEMTNTDTNENTVERVDIPLVLPDESIEGTVSAPIETILNETEMFAKKDNLIYVSTETSLPYFVGKEQTSYLTAIKGQYDMVVYLELPMYLPDTFGFNCTYEVSNDTIATVEGNELVPLRQGLIELTVHTENETIKKRIAITTYNDGKEVKKDTSFNTDNNYLYADIKNPEQWKTQINTIPDMVAYLQSRNFCYDGREPDFCGRDGWQWTASGSDISVYNGGVCVQVAQCANYMLAGNFEDWGNIIVFGYQGHIFNWFYEDGKYYIMDFTDVISDNNNYVNNPTYRSFNSSIKSFRTIDEIKEYIKNEKVDTSMNYLVCMYSCLGYDYMPAWKDAGMKGCSELYDHPNENYIFGFQDIVADQVEVLWQDPNINITIKGYTAEEIGLALRCSEVALYNDDVNCYFKY